MRATATIGRLCLVPLLLVSLALCKVGAQGKTSAPALRVTSDDYQLDFWIANPGGSASGGPYTVECAAGQAEVGTMSSDRYTVSGGVWGGEVVTPSHWVYLPIILRTALISVTN
jgi:hypothetical protein